MKYCSKCKLHLPSSIFVGKKCYSCIIAKGAPCIKIRGGKYSRALAVTLALKMPLNIVQAREVVEIKGLKDLQFYPDLANEKLIKFDPVTTLFDRVLKFVRK